LNGSTVRAASLRPLKIWQGVAILVAWGGAVAISQWLFQSFKFGWLVAAPFYVTSIALPVLLLLWIGLGGLPIGSRNRFWSMLGIGLTGAPVLASILELIVYLGIFILAILIIAFNPGWLATINQLREQLTSTTDTNVIVQALQPYIFNPIALAIVFFVMSVMTPMVEEAIKPILIWFTGKHIQSPATGFALGALSGAGFALIEGLMASSSPDSSWAVLLIARAGGSLMHILGSGLMGWAIVSAWHGKKSRLIWTYLLCIAIHGTWNAAAVIMELGSFQGNLHGTANAFIPDLSLVGTGILGALVLIIFSLLVLVNWKLRRSAAPVPISPENPSQSQ
jgi:hypothetical protein